MVYISLHRDPPRDTIDTVSPAQADNESVDHSRPRKKAKTTAEGDLGPMVALAALIWFTGAGTLATRSPRHTSQAGVIYLGQHVSLATTMGDDGDDSGTPSTA